MDTDVRRFRGLTLAIVFGVVALAAFVLARTDPGLERAPGPLFGPHAARVSSCASCHTPDAAPHEACVACHGPHPSTRRGHADALARGAMTCTTCHREHVDHGGVVIDPDGALRRVVLDRSRPLTTRGRAGLATTVHVPTAGACGGCHRLDAADDPIARCLAGPAALGGDRPSLCFDEHRVATTGGLARVDDRIAAWDIASRALLVEPEPPAAPTPRQLPAILGLAVAGLASAVGFTLARRRRRAVEPTAPAIAPPTLRRLPQVNANTCIGCAACVDVCPYGVLELQRYVAAVARPRDCCGIGTCQTACPNGSLVIADGPPIDDGPGVGPDLQAVDVPGLYLAGDLTGLPLIRNAINQGAHCIDAIAERGSDRPDDGIDVVIVGAGPAGLSAALRAKERGLRAVVLEQGAVAQSIRSFPRDKLVCDLPLGVPLVGDLWLAEATKEALLAKWMRIIRSQAIDVREHTRVTAIERRAGRFEVGTVGGDRFVAGSVVVAIGRRGTPRRLPIAIDPSLEHRVHYSLADAASLAGRRVVIVGLGDVAMEAAIALARQPGTRVSIAYRGETFGRGKARNIEQIERLAANGRLTVHWRAEVRSIAAEALTLESPAGPQTMPWDHLFVLIGALTPWDFLERAGVRRAQPRSAGHVDPSPRAAR